MFGGSEVTSTSPGELTAAEIQDPDPRPVASAPEPASWLQLDETDEIDGPAPSVDNSNGTTLSARVSSAVATAAARDYSHALCSADGFGSPCGRYYGRVAGAYARGFAITNGGRDRNHDYNYYDNDCTNFVSQALHFGGMYFTRTASGINDPRHDDQSLYIRGAGSWWAQKYTAVPGANRYRSSASWAVSNVLYTHLLTTGLARSLAPGEPMRTGDAIFARWNGGNAAKDITHALIVAKVRKRKVWIAQHTTDRYETWAAWQRRAVAINPNTSITILRPTSTRFDLP